MPCESEWCGEAITEEDKVGVDVAEVVVEHEGVERRGKQLESGDV